MEEVWNEGSMEVGFGIGNAMRLSLTSLGQTQNGASNGQSMRFGPICLARETVIPAFSAVWRQMPASNSGRPVSAQHDIGGASHQ
jgi:hypothetical protein